VELISGDLHDHHALHTLLKGSQSVIHLAGAVRGYNYQSFEFTNVQGTENLCQAARSQIKPPRILHFSSIVAREPQLSWYSRSKRAAEDCLHKDHSGLDWTIIRPPAVYGPGDKEMLPIFRTMAKGLAPVPGDINARTSLIHVDDLASAAIRCLMTDTVSGQTFQLHDGRNDGYNWTEMAAIAAEIYGRPVRLWPVPRLLLDTIAGANLGLAKLSRRAPMLTPPKLRELRHPDWVADNIAISAAVGWSPHIELQQGLQALQKSAF
jgi:nucleoside-diphosphate-sugar epimerase